MGLAYQLNPETVVRAGYGRFFMLFERAGSEDQLSLNLPFLVNNVVSLLTLIRRRTTCGWQSGFNLSLDPSAVNVTTVRLRAVNPEAVDPCVDQWNLGIQRLLPGNMVATLDYVGNKRIASFYPAQFEPAATQRQWHHHERRWCDRFYRIRFWDQSSIATTAATRFITAAS